jgi:hypothetical protein
MRFQYLLAACALAFCIGDVKADTIFDVTGAYNSFNNIPGTFTGTITASATAFTAGTVTTSTFGTFDQFVIAGTGPGTSSIVLEGSGNHLNLRLA